MARQFLCTQTEPVVQTKAGKLRGFLLDGVYTFHGIRYAQAGRFEMPREVEPWEGIKDALSYGYVCPLINQPEPSGEVMVPHRYWPQREDCLFLNVWSTSLNPDTKKPVMVWLHGGGFSDGSSIEHVAYDGENLSRFGDVVVVSLNHRLNVLGYLDVSFLGEKYRNSANAGTEDIVAALRWVRDKIAAFGGDPENVTLFGQSGGGAKVWTLLQTPSAFGLFHKGIIQSGVYDLHPIRNHGGNELCLALLEKLGISKEEKLKLLDIPYEKLAKAYWEIFPEFEKRGQYRGLAPMENSWMLGDPRTNGFSSFAKQVPLLIGTVLGEFSFGPAVPGVEHMTEEEKEALISRRYGAQYAPALLDAFREAYPGKEITDLLFVDLLFRLPTRDFIMKRVDSSPVPVYSYQFTYDFPYDGIHAPWHCCEIPFVFHNSDKIPYCNIPGVSDSLEEQMSGAWVQFARTGNPNVPSLPFWPACGEGEENVMLFDENCCVKKNVDAKLLSLLQQVPEVFPIDGDDAPVQH